MALEILRPEHETHSWVVATQRLWRTSDGDRLVEDGDPDAATLFCVPGNRIPLDDAVRYGLVVAEPEKVEADDDPEPEKIEAKPTAKRARTTK